ncbi:MAG: hypothetical protein ACPG19_06000 [Saprospiraceae bacterium]
MKQLIILTIGAIAFSSCNTSPCAFNIDKLEILAKFNVPKLDKGLYHCNQIDNIKISFMDIATDKLTEGTIDDFLEQYSFSKENAIHPSQLRSWETLPDDFKDIIPVKADFYVKKANNSKTDWIVIIERNTGYMWAEIEYKE